MKKRWFNSVNIILLFNYFLSFYFCIR